MDCMYWPDEDVVCVRRKSIQAIVQKFISILNILKYSEKKGGKNYGMLIYDWENCGHK